MLVDLIHVTTADGLRLDGALHAVTTDAPPAHDVDAVMIIHGTGSNFYSSNLLGYLAEAFVSRGTAALVVNTRGHDGISTTLAPLGMRQQGAAYELVDACCHDVAAWLELLRSRGYGRVGLVGHSLGAVKAIYSQAHQADPAVQWIAALSPPRLSYSTFAQDSHAEEFLNDYRRALELVGSGRPRELLDIRYPLVHALSAESFLDKYGPEERYNILNFVAQVSCPIVSVYGALELPTNAAFRDMPELIAASGEGQRHSRVVAGADHVYAGTYADLFGHIEAGLRKLNIV